MNLSKKLRNIATTIVLLGAATGVIFSVNTYVAKAKDIKQLEARFDQSLTRIFRHVQQVATRLDQKILQDRISFLQDQIYKIQDRYGYEIGKMPQEVRDTYRRLKQELEEAEKKLEILMKRLS